MRGVHTLRPGWRLALLGGVAIGVVAGFFTLGWVALFGLVVVALLLCFARPRVRLTEEGIAYRGMWPSEDCHLRWAELTQVVVDAIDQGSPGNSMSRVARLRLLTADRPPRAAILWSVRAADPVIEAARRHGVEVLDER